MDAVELMSNPPSQKEMDDELLGHITPDRDDEQKRTEMKRLVSEIWKAENTLDRLLEILQENHEGDIIPLKVILLSYIQGKITDMEETIYFTIHAEAGEGKSHIFQTAASILPQNLVWDSGFSDKFLSRAKDIVIDGSIVCFDDLELTRNIIQIMKICSNRKRDPLWSVLEGADNKPKQYPLPKWITFITIRVDQVETADYEQIMSRNILVYADSASEHMEKVFDLIRKRGSKEYTENHIDLKMFRELFWENFPPYFHVDTTIAEHLGCTKGISTRQIEQCITLIRLFAVYRLWDGGYNNKIVKDNVVYLTAEKKDLDAAIEFYNPRLKGDGGDQVFKLTKVGNEIRNFLKNNYPDSVKVYPNYKELAREMGKYDPNGQRAIYRALYGREDSKGKERTNHVLGTVPGISAEGYSETISDNEGNEDGRYSRKTFKKFPIKWDGNEYQKSCPNTLTFYYTKDKFRKYGE